MTHQIRWSKVGWQVVSSLGGMVIASMLVTSYADAVIALAALVGVA